jgi:lysophospholipase L1-like esterase
MRTVVAGAIACVCVGAMWPNAVAGAAGPTEPEAAPLHVLLVGDSITGSYQDEAAAALRARGYEVTVDAIGGSGLRDLFACHGRRPKALRRLDADVVVYQSIGVYGMRPRCSATPRGTPRFYAQWENEAEAAQRILTRNGARFLWILNPQTEPPWAVDRFNAIYQTTAGADDGTELIDAWSAFGGATYNPAFHLPDGIHLNQAGQSLLAQLVVDAVG